MEKLVLSDPSTFPDKELLTRILGPGMQHWEMLLDRVHRSFPGATELWKYYNDGKNWLFRVIIRKKTLFWIGLPEQGFRISFYFGDKAEPLIENSALPEQMIRDFKNSKRYGQFRAISFRIEGMEDIENALILVAIRARV